MTQHSIPATMTDLERARKLRREITAQERRAEEVWKASAAVARRDKADLTKIRKAKKEAEDSEERLVALFNLES